MANKQHKFQQDKYPISLRWSISRREIENRNFLQTKDFVANSFFGVTYSVRFFVAETHQDERGNAAIYFYVNPMYLAEGVNAEISISVPTLGTTYPSKHLYKDAHDWGVPFCRSDFFLEKNSPAFNGDKFIIEIKGFLSVSLAANASSFQIFDQNPLGSNILDRGDTDFTLVMDGKKLHVHKTVIAACSDVFADTFQVVNMKEEENNRLEIDDFSFETVEAAIMFMYEKNGYINDSNIVEVCKFADKFEIKGFKDIITPYMKFTLSSMNVCKYINAAYHLHDSALEKKCMERLHQFITNKIAVDIDELYPGLAKKYIDFSSCTHIG